MKFAVIVCMREEQSPSPTGAERSHGGGKELSATIVRLSIRPLNSCLSFPVCFSSQKRAVFQPFYYSFFRDFRSFQEVGLFSFFFVLNAKPLREYQSILFELMGPMGDNRGCLPEQEG